MRIQFMSDLHLEFDKDYGEACIGSLGSALADVLVIAGDLAPGPLAYNALREICEIYYPRPVVYVPGNHEYYGQMIEPWKAGLRQLASEIKNLVALDNAIATISGQRFVGSTLWYTTELRNWSDFRHISGLSSSLQDLSREAVQFLRTNIMTGDVVVTHMLPSRKLVSQKWVGDPDNVFFVNDINDLVEHRGAKVWIFGHTHDHIDVKLGSTICVCNPRGYPHERQSGNEFNPSTFIDV